MTVKSAVLSDCGRYRYLLTRRWSPEPLMVFVMLNPSTADAEQDDPTIRRCMGFARREGCGGIEVVNLFALRVTRPVHLFDGSIADDPNGPENWDHVECVVLGALASGRRVVCAWGAFKDAHRAGVFPFLGSLGRRLLCLGTTADGSPRHPLYLPAAAPLVPWRAK